MNEGYIAQSIIDAILEVASKRNATKIKSATIVIGQLKFIDKEALTKAFKALSKKTAAEGAELKIKVKTAEFKCKNCNFQWRLNEELINARDVILLQLSPEYINQVIKCPICMSKNCEVLSGYEMYIENVEIII
ncbi:MAG: hydrogenase maturation nickel metallochaperone HypA [archaeon GB-1845-036]|nr:hydrogenase maturation nickel metallochaperone HypA [Candidatus Culexmicrobium thermophilum]RLE55996.1 MAG: hypothetical protein DRJ30_02895 [Candidatus Verstraetearchaeota archaeon]